MIVQSDQLETYMSAKSVRKSAKEATEKLCETFKSKPKRKKSNRLQITDENISDTSLDSGTLCPLTWNRNHDSCTWPTSVNQFFPSNCEFSPPVSHEIHTLFLVKIANKLALLKNLNI